MFKALLCIPPDYDHNFPPLGTPALCAFLKKNDIGCAQLDLNLGYRDFLAQRIYGSSPLGLKEQRIFLKPVLEKFFAQKLKGRYYSEFLPRNTDGPFPQLPYGNNTNSSFYFYERLISSELLWRYLEDKNENTFLQYYENSGILDLLEKENIKLFGISIISPTQVIASLTLGLLIKKRAPGVHVTIGGQWATLYRNEIARKKELFKCFDSAIIYEGESALCQLARTLEAKKNISGVPNIILNDTDLNADFLRLEENLDALPCPDFDGLALNDYDGSRDGKISLTFETSRGCYWSKCAYCVDLPLPKPSYRRKDPRLVVEDMKELKQKYNAQYLFFGDPGLSARQMREISERMIKEGVRMELWTMARLDPGFNRALFDLAYAAGFRQINFGFESANDRVCKSLDKGNSKERSARIIKDSAASGIRVGLQTMLGLPGESFQEGLDTVDFLVSNKEFIFLATFNKYYLTPFNFIHQNPGKYGIDYEKDPKLPFRFFIPFKNTRGMDSERAEMLEKMYYSFMSKESVARAKDTTDTGHMPAGHINFYLNGESCGLKYLYNQTSGEYTFFEDENSRLDERVHDAV